MRIARIGILSALLAGAGTLVSAQSPGWTPTLELRAEVASMTGDRTSTSGAWALVTGQPVSSTITAASDLCAVGGGQLEPSRNSAHADNLWKFTASLVDSDAKGYRIRFLSQFERVAAGAVPTPSIFELVLREGQDVTLETLRPVTDGPCHVRNVAIRARVVLRSADPAAQAARYVGEVWLIHDTGVEPSGAGTRKSQSVAVKLDGSGPADFGFEPLQFALPQLSPLQGDLAAFIRVSGSLRARMRTDGQIDVDVDTLRIMGLRKSTDPENTRGGSTGHKSLTLREDETIAIDLPQISSGYAAHALTPDAKFNVGGGVRAGGQPAAAPFTGIAEVKNNVMQVNTGLLFKGHKTQILIRLRKARE